MKKIALSLATFLCLHFFLINSITAKTVVIREDVSSTNGVFVGNTWTPTPGAGTSILDYSELLTKLATGDVIISTNGAGDIRFEGADWTTSTGYDLAVDRILSLNAEGDIIIENAGIHPVLPANVGKLKININSNTNGDLLVKGAGLRTNGGDLTITGVDNVFQYESGIFTNNGPTFGKVTFTGKVFKLGIDENGNSASGNMAVGDLELNVDTAAFNSFDLLQIGAFDVNTDVVSFKSGTVRYGATSGMVGDTFGIKADSTYGESVHFFWREDITFDSKIICLEGFRVEDTTLNHQSDIVIIAEKLETREGFFNLRNGMGNRLIDFDISKVGKFDGTSAIISRGDGIVNINATDSLLLYGCTKDNSGQGNRVGIEEGDGDLNVYSNYLLMNDTRANIFLGQGNINISGTEQIDLGNSNVLILGDDVTQTVADTISIKTKVLHYGDTEVSIKRAELLDNYIDVVAADTFLANDYYLEKANTTIEGGAIRFGLTPHQSSVTYSSSYHNGNSSFNSNIQINPTQAIANGNLNIESSWMDFYDLDVSQHGGTGNVDVSGDILKVEKSGFRTNNGGIALEALDSLDFFNSDIRINGTADDLKNDISIKTKEFCINKATVYSGAADNLTDLFITADNATFVDASFDLSDGMGSRLIDFDFSKVGKFDATNVVLRKSDGNVSVAATDSLLLYACSKEDSGDGNRIAIEEGNGDIDLHSNFLRMNKTRAHVFLGQGNINISGTEQIDLGNSNVLILGDDVTQTVADTISIKTKVLHYGDTEVSIKRA